ncbi:MAG: hypothetical protein LBQ66_00585 [Planctomycetaceae bacterium]|nr:hypothetical protein [Planctomycetaceae bacterium]
MPTRFGVQFHLVRFYYAQRRAGRPRSSPSPLRGKIVWYNEGCIPTEFEDSVRTSFSTE